MVCQFLLYNKVNQLYIYIYIYPHISSLLRLPPTLPIPPLQVVTEHRADLPVLCGCFPLAIYFTFGSVYMLVLLSHFVPAYPSPSRVLKSILYVCVNNNSYMYHRELLFPHSMWQWGLHHFKFFPNHVLILSRKHGPRYTSSTLPGLCI